MAQFSGRLEEEISTLQIELNRGIEKRQECIDYSVKNREAFKRSRPKSEVCREMRTMYETFHNQREQLQSFRRSLIRR